MMPTTFEFVRQRLVEAGYKGVSPADLFKELRESEVLRRKGTYSSFFRGFWMLRQLHWVEHTGMVETSYQRGVNTSGVLEFRGLYRITSLGITIPPESWSNPRNVLYPFYAESGAWRKWYKSTGRPVGRPRTHRWDLSG